MRAAGQGYAGAVPIALPARSAAPSSRRSEAVFAVVIALGVVASLIVRVAQGETAVALLLAVPALAAILLRHRRPLEALALAVAVNAAIPDNRALVFPVLLVLYTSALRRSWSTLRLAALAVGAVVTEIVAWLAWGNTGTGGESVLGFVIGNSAQAAASVALGLYIGARRREVDALHERAERLDRERELLADRAVAEERVRIAQELHDVVAHNVSLMVVRAQALGVTLDEEPVKSTTDAIAELGRDAMTEMHRTLRLLRTDAIGAAELTPQPGLAMLERLLEQTRAAGLDIELTVEGQPRPLSQGVDLSAFRIIQEALTNVLKHAGRARTQITLSYCPEDLRVTIIDSGDEATQESERPPEDWAEGHGLIGMRERATLFGGTLTAAAGVRRGFTVSATLPYEEPGA
ncbi:MAG: two-component system sensor kinase [Solirubrobacterales bacterium]|nr:two-component system sensor kinase [Solirubrobacterales bacterium]MCW3025434.1 two-component system sensor kinase [Solirubrobacterales bacterium]